MLSQRCQDFLVTLERRTYIPSSRSLRDVGLIMCRDPGLSSREMLELELELRGASAVIEETYEGISFVTGSRRFRGITTFEDMRDILRWNARDF